MDSQSLSITCPLCGEDNHCGVAERESCWCRKVEIPRELLSKVPADHLGTSCICAQCVEAFHAGRKNGGHRFPDDRH